MVQPTQPTAQPAVQPTAQQPVPAAVPAAQQPVAQPPVKKKSKWWIWLIVAVVVIGVAVGLYFLLT